MLDLPRPAHQKLDGVSYAAVLKGTGSLDRRAFFNYFPHGRSPGRAGGVWVRSGDWKLIRWFGLPAGDENLYELYNLREDLSETQNLAAGQPARVQELAALIDGFLTDTRATYPRPNPGYQLKAAKPRATPTPENLLEGWKTRQCEAVVKAGILTVTSQGKPGAAFLGHGTGKLEGPAVLKFRARTSAGGAGRIESRPNNADDSTATSFAFDLPSGDWREVSVEIAASGPLGIIRIYLPATEKPVEVDWIELRGKAADARPQRWEFNGD